MHPIEIYKNMRSDKWYISDIKLYNHESIFIGSNNLALAEVFGIENVATANADAICNAVNSTYGQGIDPACVPEMLKALKEVENVLRMVSLIDKTNTSEKALNNVKRIIEAATLTKSSTVKP